ncbi:hypothetical protein [Marinospirillum insulare]|uniref:Uncharacterized protein n=1 Tax=Marinospirillum insulare TaxID=217169 RepID=A0ABQ5ZXD4_9GAMM|nr:hypothetical protein [Marinospirillum insulare]GLR64639.1 hypothetical protein GCM10007878_20770 [Marinospirillum insulare]
MLTTFYWITSFTIIFAIFYLIAIRFSKPKPALVVTLVLALGSYSFYYFYLEQLLVKRYGGSMVIQIPDGQHHLGVTWKDDHLWIENYDPIKNECIFREYSRGSVLEGQVKLRNCNPWPKQLDSSTPITK